MSDLYSFSRWLENKNSEYGSPNWIMREILRAYYKDQAQVEESVKIK